MVKFFSRKINYTIVVDFGIPYDIKVETKEQLKIELDELDEIYAREDHPYFDVWVYDENNKDITDKVFKEHTSSKVFGEKYKPT